VLDALEAEVLRKLEMLSEGGTSNLDPNRVHQSPAGSNPPPGITEALQSDLSPEASLWAYHSGQLKRAREKSFATRLTAIARAELDLERQLKRPPSYISPDSEQNAKDRDEAILRWTGRRPEEVAVFEGCSASYVRKIRKRCHRDQTWGGSLDGFEARPAA
jgi:hypothetical protein